MDEFHGRPLYDFAYVHKIDERLEELKNLAEPENWNYTRTQSEHKNPILYYFFHNTFERVQDQKKVSKSADNEFLCFNTGLVTEHQEPIFALFGRNKEVGRE